MMLSSIKPLFNRRLPFQRGDRQAMIFDELPMLLFYQLDRLIANIRCETHHPLYRHVSLSKTPP